MKKNRKAMNQNMFSQAIVRTPCHALTEGITTSNLGKPDYELAIKQHNDYIQALKECGLTVTVLPADENHPDSTFVEDVALMTPKCSILTNPGAISRSGEIKSMLPALQKLTNPVALISDPGKVEAGDIMVVGKHYYIGLSERTNQQGAEQLTDILLHQGLTASVVALSEVLHLKTGINYLENNNFLAVGEFLTNDEFQSANLLAVDSDEAYAANSVWINGTVLLPEGFPKTKNLIESTGYKTRPVDVSEFQKLDGGLSCLSLRF